MSGGRFDFAVDPYALLTASGLTDGTANPQVLLAFASGFVRNVHPVNVPGFIIEPIEARGDALIPMEGSQPLVEKGKPGTATIDSLPRMLIFAGRTGGGGTVWNYRLSLRRGAGGTNETRVIVAAGVIEREDDYTGSVGPIVLEDPFPFDFMRQSVGSPALFDVLQWELQVTPGAATASQVSFFAMMLPSQRGNKDVGDGGRGHLLGATKIR